MAKGRIIRKTRQIMAYATAKAYAIDTMVLKDDKFYRSNSAIAPGTVFKEGTLDDEWTEVSKTEASLVPVHGTTGVTATAGQLDIIEETAPVTYMLPEADTQDINARYGVMHLGTATLTVASFDGVELIDTTSAMFTLSRYNTAIFTVIDVAGTKTWIQLDFVNDALARLVRTDIENGEQHVHLDDALLILEQPLQLENLRISSLGDTPEFKSERGVKSIPVIQKLNDDMSTQYPIARINGAVQEEIAHLYDGQTEPTGADTIDSLYRTDDVALAPNETYEYEITPIAEMFVQNFKIKLADGIAAPGAPIIVKGWLGPKAGEAAFVREGTLESGWVRFDAHTEYQPLLHTFELSCAEAWGIRADTTINSPVPANNHPARNSTTNSRSEKNMPAYPGFIPGTVYSPGSTIVIDGVLWAMRDESPAGEQTGTFTDNVDMWYRIGTKQKEGTSSRSVTVAEFNALTSAKTGDIFTIIDSGILALGQTAVPGQSIIVDHDLDDSWTALTALEVVPTTPYLGAEYEDIRDYSENDLGETLRYCPSVGHNRFLFQDASGTVNAYTAPSNAAYPVLRNADVLLKRINTLGYIPKAGGPFTTLRNNIRLFKIIPGTTYAICEDTSSGSSVPYRLDTSNGNYVQLSSTMAASDPSLESWDVMESSAGVYTFVYRAIVGGAIMTKTVSTPTVGTAVNTGITAAFRSATTDLSTGVYWITPVDLTTDIFYTYNPATTTADVIPNAGSMGINNNYVTCPSVSGGVAVINTFNPGEIHVVDFEDPTAPVVLNTITDVSTRDVSNHNSSMSSKDVNYETDTQAQIKTIRIKRRGTYSLIGAPGATVLPPLEFERQALRTKLLLASTAETNYLITATVNEGTVVAIGDADNFSPLRPTTLLDTADEISYPAGLTGAAIGNGSFSVVVMLRTEELSTSPRRICAFDNLAGIFTSGTLVYGFVRNTANIQTAVTFSRPLLGNASQNEYDMLTLTFNEDEKRVRIYKDTELMAEEVATLEHMSLATAPFSLGGWGNIGHKGNYDSWQVYHGELAHEEIIELHKEKIKFGVIDTVTEKGISWEAKTYVVGETVVEDNQRYICITAGAQATSFVTNVASWYKLDYNDLVRESSFVTNTDYSHGDRVSEGGKIYTCNANWGTQTGTFADNIDKWDEFQYNAPQVGTVKGRKILTGYNDDNVTNKSVTFPAGYFKETPEISCTAANSIVYFNAIGVSVNGFSTTGRMHDGGTSTTGVHWIAVGTATDLEEEPSIILSGREVQTGTVDLSTSVQAITFDAPFSTVPQVIATSASGGTCNVALSSLSGNGFTATHTDSTGAPVTGGTNGAGRIQYIAVGEMAQSALNLDISDSNTNPFIPTKARNWEGLILSGTTAIDSKVFRTVDSAQRESGTSGRNVNQCLEFSQVSGERIGYPASSSGAKLGKGAFTMMLSVMPSGVTTTAQVAIGFAVGPRIWWTDTLLTMNSRSNTGGSIALPVNDRTAIGFTNDAWHDLVLTFSGGDGGTLTGYIDGVAFSSIVMATCKDISAIPLHVGAQVLDYPMEGLVDHWQLWDRELSAAEVLALHEDRD